MYISYFNQVLRIAYNNASKRIFCRNQMKLPGTGNTNGNKLLIYQ